MRCREAKAKKGYLRNEKHNIPLLVEVPRLNENESFSKHYT